MGGRSASNATVDCANRMHGLAPGDAVKHMPMRIKPAWTCLLALVIAIPSFGAPADTATGAQEEPVATTQHQIAVSGQTLTYTAEAGRIAIRNVETGSPHAYMFYTAYRVASQKARPLTFVWNGGPGSDSSALHFQVAGPVRAEGGKLVPNDDTWLTATDLVFVDPIGTGFSRPVSAAYDAEFYGTVGDVASVAEFVRAWRILHDAHSQPLFLVGESWGARRASSVAYALEARAIPIKGIVLISGGAGLNSQPVPPALTEALRVVDLTATAFYYHRTARALGDNLARIQTQAEAWAQGEYAPALSHLQTLSAAQRARIVARLAAFTGLSERKIDQQTLTITPAAYRTELLADERKVLNTFDMRVTAEDPAADPAADAILHYFRDSLGYRFSLPYIGIEDWQQGYAPNGMYPTAINARWNYATIPIDAATLKAAIEAAAKRGGGPPTLGPPLPATAEALKLNPHLEVLVAAGRYDSLNSCAVNRQMARRLAPAFQKAIEFKCYVGGHMMYRDTTTRPQFSQDIRMFIAGATDTSSDPGVRK